MSPVPGSARIEHLAQAVAERVVTLVMDAIDVNAILARIDVEGLVERVDVEKIIERVDVEKVVERIDIEKILEQVDIDALIERTEIGTLIVKSTSGVAGEVLDAIRASTVGLDDFLARWVNRLLRRKPAELPTGPTPPAALATDGTHVEAPGGDRERAVRAGGTHG